LPSDIEYILASTLCSSCFDLPLACNGGLALCGTPPRFRLFLRFGRLCLLPPCGRSSAPFSLGTDYILPRDKRTDEFTTRRLQRLLFLRTTLRSFGCALLRNSLIACLSRIWCLLGSFDILLTRLVRQANEVLVEPIGLFHSFCFNELFE
jgi:hypothetical protein